MECSTNRQALIIGPVLPSRTSLWACLMWHLWQCQHSTILTVLWITRKVWILPLALNLVGGLMEVVPSQPQLHYGDTTSKAVDCTSVDWTLEGIWWGLLEKKSGSPCECALWHNWNFFDLWKSNIKPLAQVALERCMKYVEACVLQPLTPLQQNVWQVAQGTLIPAHITVWGVKKFRQPQIPISRVWERCPQTFKKRSRITGNTGEWYLEDITSYHLIPVYKHLVSSIWMEQQYTVILLLLVRFTMQC